MTSSASPIEHEVKLRLSDPESLRARLRESGQLIEPSAYECNDVFDTPAGELRRDGRLLRLREIAGRTICTFKGPPTLSNGVRSRREIETRMDDAEAFRGIAEGLGFVRTFRYEKLRETWRFCGCEIVLDDTAMGWFAEIEGPPEAIHAAAAELGLDEGAFLGLSYARLWYDWRREHPGAPTDMVFVGEERRARGLPS